MLRALAAGMNIGSVPVGYIHPPEQTAAEEGNMEMDAKRLKQRQELVPAVLNEAIRLRLISAS